MVFLFYTLRIWGWEVKDKSALKVEIILIALFRKLSDLRNPTLNTGFVIRTPLEDIDNSLFQ